MSTKKLNVICPPLQVRHLQDIMSTDSRWYRQHFYDHPELQRGSPAAYANLKEKRAKVACKPCFDARIIAERERDEEELRNGQRVQLRSQADIISWLWSIEARDVRGPCPWIQGRSETLVRHLKNCQRQPIEIRQLATAMCIEKGWNRGPPSPRQRLPQLAADNLYRFPSEPAVPMASGPGPSSISLNSPPAHAQTLLGLNIMPGSSIHSQSAMGTIQNGFPHDRDTSLDSKTLLFSQLHSESPYGTPPALTPVSGSPLSISFAHSVPGSPLLSETTDLRPGSSKRQRVLSHRRSHSVGLYAGSGMSAVRSAAYQDRFGAHLARITASCNFPTSWVNNKAVQDFIEEMLPAIVPISSYRLAHRYIPQELKKFQEDAKEKCRGADVTLQTDGWTGVNSQHLVAFMMTTSTRKVHTLQVLDVSSDKRTAEHLKNIILDVKKDVEVDWKVSVIAITSDASGESRAARKQILEEFPWLVTPDCYAHQINLVVGDYFKLISGVFSIYTKKATDLIAWARSKSRILALLREIQLGICQAKGSEIKVLSVIRAVITRWTAHYLAFRRLLELRQSFKILVDREKAASRESKFIVAGDSTSRKKGAEILNTLQDPLFWHTILRIVKHIEPLALAANIAQTVHCRLDEILITFGFLLTRYHTLINDTLSVDSEECRMIKSIIDSLEKRWSKCEQEVFYAAVILNPIYKTAPFARLHIFTNAGVYVILSRLWKRFYQQDPPHELLSELVEYLSNAGGYKSLPNFIEAVRADPTGKPEFSDPLFIFNALHFAGRPPTPLHRLASRILSISANSASCERLFSSFGTILTKLRSRLAPKHMLDLAQLRMHLRDEYMLKTSPGERLRRKRRLASTVASSDSNECKPDPGPGPIETSSSPASRVSPFSSMTTSTSIPSTTTTNIPIVDKPSASTYESADEADDDDIDDPDSFESIARNLQERCQLDDAGGVHDFTSPAEKIPLERLFDFSDTTWIEITSRTSMKSINEELELYELVELDGEGEADDGDVVNDPMLFR